VTLYQATDDGANYSKVKETKTDDNGAFQFNGVQVTGGAPDNSPIYGSKKFYVSATYKDASGKEYTQNKSFTLYNPDTLTGNEEKDQQNRNVVANITVPYSKQGWVMLSTDTDTPPGIGVYDDENNSRLKDANGNDITTLPSIAYLQPGPHTIRFSASGYDDQKIRVNIQENQQTQNVVAHMNPSAVSPEVIFAVAILILLAAIVAIVVLLVKKRHMIAGPLGGIASSIKGVFSKPRASSNKTSKSNYQPNYQDGRRATEQNVEQRPRAPRPRGHSAAVPPTPQEKIRGRKSIDQDLAAADSDRPGLPEYRGYNTYDDYDYGYDDEPRDRRVRSREIRRRAPSPRTTLNESDYYDYPMEYDDGQGGYDAKPLSPAADPREPEDGRIRIPRSLPMVRDQPPVISVKDKERVIRYIHDHEDGVSFIQMSNDLEIDTTILNIITKELVINDDIEKIRGLYYYKKSHDASDNIHESSVVVWRLDGDE